VATALDSRFTATRVAMASGRVSAEQATAVVRVLDQLPDHLSLDHVEAAETTMLGFTDEFDPQGLARLAKATLDVVAPEVADEAERRRLDLQERRARRTRSIHWSSDGDGSLLMCARLPNVDGEMLRELVEAIAAEAPRVDADGERVGLEARRADGLMAVVHGYLRSSQGPERGGDRPRVTVLVDYDVLRSGLSGATLVGPHEPISAGDARRLACDADLLPIVLGGASQVLDVGRTRRLFTDDLRQALVARDRGCVFAACDRPACACEAHHLVPWWDGGPTSLDNGALHCPYHHRLVEPDPGIPEHQQWHLRMSRDHVPEALPPAYVDPERRPRRHERFRQRPLGPRGGS